MKKVLIGVLIGLVVLLTTFAVLYKTNVISFINKSENSFNTKDRVDIYDGDNIKNEIKSLSLLELNKLNLSDYPEAVLEITKNYGNENNEISCGNSKTPYDNFLSFNIFIKNGQLFIKDCKKNIHEIKLPNNEKPNAFVYSGISLSEVLLMVHSENNNVYYSIFDTAYWSEDYEGQLQEAIDGIINKAKDLVLFNSDGEKILGIGYDENYNLDNYVYSNNIYYKTFSGFYNFNRKKIENINNSYRIIQEIPGTAIFLNKNSNIIYLNEDSEYVIASDKNILIVNHILKIKNGKEDLLLLINDNKEIYILLKNSDESYTLKKYNNKQVISINYNTISHAYDQTSIFNNEWYHDVSKYEITYTDGTKEVIENN